jgi:hypothetical protein
MQSSLFYDSLRYKNVTLQRQNTMKNYAPRHRLILTAFSGLILFCSCDRQDTQPGPGGLAPQDAQVLDEAAAKLDAQTLPPTEPNAKGKEARK